MKLAKCALVGAMAGALLAGCVPGEEADACTGKACNTTRLDLLVAGDDVHACTMLLTTPQGASWTAQADVRAALERQGRRIAISAVQSSGGVLPADIGEIRVREEDADAVEVVRVQCFDRDGVAVEPAEASLRRRAP